jgi:hypothetical protein
VADLVCLALRPSTKFLEKRRDVGSMRRAIVFREAVAPQPQA